MPQKLFQDAAGTIPAILAGQPVGLAVLAKGTVNASQATALSKPTLSRHPKGGVRNLAMGAQAVGNVSFWPASQASGGVTVTKVGSGVEGGIPYVDFRFVGTVTTNNGQVPACYVNANSSRATVIGDRFHAKAIARLIGGTFPLEPTHFGIRVQIEGRNAGVTYEEGGASAVGARSNEDTVLSKTHVMADPDTVTARVMIMLQFAKDATVDATFRIKGLSFEYGDGQSPFQFNYGPNDITEQGVPDDWHLYNDGGDSLNVVLPAGQYGCAFIDLARNVTIETVTSDGTTPINTVRAERQLDYAIRAGAYTEIEARAIRERWSREYA